MEVRSVCDVLILLDDGVVLGSDACPVPGDGSDRTVPRPRRWCSASTAIEFLDDGRVLPLGASSHTSRAQYHIHSVFLQRVPLPMPAPTWRVLSFVTAEFLDGGRVLSLTASSHNRRAQYLFYFLYILLVRDFPSPPQCTPSTRRFCFMHARWRQVKEMASCCHMTVVGP